MANIIFYIFTLVINLFGVIMWSFLIKEGRFDDVRISYSALIVCSLAVLFSIYKIYKLIHKN